ncbi:MAG: hypothetical protein BWY70_00894 [Bacteroidetes bacterium ADurb.Bin408]|nr:MAG: hypothetical protein BWY70_00894 [Bacteroidetes bacterium ADurb.Bin408]
MNLYPLSLTSVMPLSVFFVTFFLTGKCTLWYKNDNPKPNMIPIVKISQAGYFFTFFMVFPEFISCFFPFNKHELQVF